VDRFAGAVLTGGSSRRMGADKALLSVEGRPLSSVAVDALTAAGAAVVVAVGGDEPELRSLGLRWVPDEEPGQGPLGGLLAALRALAPEPVVVVLACDLPRASSANVSAVVAAASEQAGRPSVAVPVADGRREWLHAAWTAEAVPVLEAAWEDGERAPRRAVDGLHVGEVAAPDPAALVDADRPEDLPDGPGAGRPGR